MADSPRVAEKEIQAAARLRASLRDFGRASEQVLHAYGLTPERYDLMLAIRGETERNGAATVGELADELGVSQSAVTQLVRRAEDAGLLRREVSSHDARVRYLQLSTDGERRLLRALIGLRPERERLARIVTELAILPERPPTGGPTQTKVN